MLLACSSDPLPTPQSGGAVTGAGAGGAAGAKAGASGASGAGGAKAGGAGGAKAGGAGGAKAGGAGGAAGAEPEKPLDPVTRDQDSREFTIDESTLPFDALADAPETDRFSGVLDGAGYRIEIPKDWNGILVMYAHGYVGPVPALRVTAPSIRRHLIEGGYAWAASSYSKNYYDVRVGIEDTNKLALKFKSIAEEKGRTVDEPTKRYLIGHSMGGHISAAAIEREAQATANNKVKYAGAVPMCGVTGDTQLFNYFAGYQTAAEQLTGVRPAGDSLDDFGAIRDQLQAAVFSEYPTATTPEGDKVKGVVMNLGGGKRPNFDLGFQVKGLQDAIWGTFGGDGTIAGILASGVIDTRDIVFQIDSAPAQSDDEKKLNADISRFEADPGANGLRKDGLRYIPVVNGEFDIPVVTLHTLGDLYVPFKMEQIYRERAESKGSGKWLVQRAIRGTSHCEFTTAEQVAAFDAMTAWEQMGVEPEGDDVLDPDKLSSADYGCKFTDNTISADETAAGSMVGAARAAAPACP